MKLQRQKSICARAALWAALFTGCAAAAPLYNNLPVPSGSGGPVSATDWLADSFSTGAGGYQFGSVTFKLLGESGGGSVSAYLYSDSSTSPGGSLLSLGSIPQSGLDPSTDKDVTLSFSPYSLAANTRYWIVLEGSSDRQLDALWARANSDTGIGVAGEGFAGSADGGSTWVVRPNEGDFRPYEMEIDSAPEPGTLAAAFSGLAGVIFLRRRKR